MVIQTGCETGFPAMQKAVLLCFGAERFSHARGSTSIQRFHQYIVSPMESHLIPAIQRLNDEALKFGASAFSAVSILNHTRD